MRRLLVSVWTARGASSHTRIDMKKLLPLCLTVLLLGAGCATHYTITLDNGAQIATKSKPKLQNGVYRYKDIQGNQTAIPSGRDVEIAPSSKLKQQKGPISPGK